MSTMVFYERPVALNREQHKNLRLVAKPGDFSFAAGINSLLLAASEITLAGREYPVVFIGRPEGPFTLAVLTGLRENENLFVDANGNWQAGAYIPAFARRYPFVLAEKSATDPELTVCFDSAYPGFSETEGDPLFTSEGADAPRLAEMMKFLVAYHDEMTRTRTFCNQIAALGLLIPRTIEVARGSERSRLDGFWAVDPNRLAALPDSEVLALFRSGALAWVHAHLLSLGQLENLGRLRDQRDTAQNAAPGDAQNAAHTAEAAGKSAGLSAPSVKAQSDLPLDRIRAADEKAASEHVNGDETAAEKRRKNATGRTRPKPH